MTLRLASHPRPSLRALFDGWVLRRQIVTIAAEATRTEFDAAQRSLQDELDIEIALTRELGKRYGVTFPELCALRVRMADNIRREDMDAEFNSIVSFLAHPSQGGEK